MENLKDQQIQNQGETITSLERKIESLERELEKCMTDLDESQSTWRCDRLSQLGNDNLTRFLKKAIKDADAEINRLQEATGKTYIRGNAEAVIEAKLLLRMLEDPDSGTISPRFKPASGEASDVELVKDDTLEARIHRIMTAAFVPVKLYNEQKEEWYYDHQAWWYFRQFLFDVDLFNNHWTRPEFRAGVELLNSIIQATAGYPKSTEQLEKHDLAISFYGHADDYDQRKHEAVQALISAMNVILENQDHEDIKRNVHEENLRDMLAALKVIAYCQRLWMDAKPQEKKAEKV